MWLSIIRVVIWIPMVTCEMGGIEPIKTLSQYQRVLELMSNRVQRDDDYTKLSYTNLNGEMPPAYFVSPNYYDPMSNYVIEQRYALQHSQDYDNYRVANYLPGMERIPFRFVQIYFPVEENTKEPSAPFGKQPLKPVYHYHPVPKGTFSVQTVEDERIKSDPPPTTIRPEQNELQSSSYEHDQNKENSPYDFYYRVADPESGLEFGKIESKSNGVTRGSYHVLLPDKRLQMVNYWSDHTGFHSSITYRDP